MPARKTLNEARLKVIYKRQASPMWDESYQPAILATPKEAPSISRAFILTPGKFNGREIHLVRPEQPTLKRCEVAKRWRRILPAIGASH